MASSLVVEVACKLVVSRAVQHFISDVLNLNILLVDEITLVTSTHQSRLLETVTPKCLKLPADPMGTLEISDGKTKGLQWQKNDIALHLIGINTVNLAH